jgi:hypothetical protein
MFAPQTSPRFIKEIRKTSITWQAGAGLTPDQRGAGNLPI